MANTLQTTMRAALELALATQFGTLKPTVSKTKTLTHGVAINQADLEWVKKDSVTSGTPKTYDLSGSLLDAAGEPVVFAKVCGLLVVNLTTTAGAILTVGAGSNPFATWLSGTTPALLVGPDGWGGVCNPSLAAYAVTAATGDILQIASASGTIDFIVGVVGRSA